nr:hypothetical protein [Tanacetum cinerariifolium]
MTCHFEWLDNGVPYQLCDHICAPYRFKNGITKWPTCSSDVDGFCIGGEVPGMVRVRSMTYFQDHKWYDELVDGKLQDETLALKAKVEGLWGDVALEVMKLCAWLINSFGNFHELENNVFVRLQECWWKINDNEVTPFTHLESYGQRPCANIKTERAHDPYLEVDISLVEIMSHAMLNTIKGMKNKGMIPLLNHQFAKSGDSR